MSDKNHVGAADWLAAEFALRQRISVAAAARLNAISEETFRRRHRDLIQKVSPAPWRRRARRRARDRHRQATRPSEKGSLWGCPFPIQSTPPGQK